MPIDPFLPPVPHLLEVAQVAHRVSSSQEYVRELLRKGLLPGIRLGKRWRVDAADLQRWIDSQRVAIARAESRIDGELSEASRKLRAVNGGV